MYFTANSPNRFNSSVLVSAGCDFRPNKHFFVLFCWSFNWKISLKITELPKRKLIQIKETELSSWLVQGKWIFKYNTWQLRNEPNYTRRHKCQENQEKRNYLTLVDMSSKIK